MKALNKFIWMVLAQLIAKPMIADWLIRRSKRTPYLHIPSNEDPSYMERYWLFNPYNRETGEPKRKWIPFSIRIHHIKREDREKHLHDHPWNARTIILKGGYRECALVDGPQYPLIIHRMRYPGDTATIGFGKYHRIERVLTGGAITLFISWRYQGVWGFLVDGHKIPWKDYLKGARHQDDI